MGILPKPGYVVVRPYRFRKTRAGLVLPSSIDGERQALIGEIVEIGSMDGFVNTLEFSIGMRVAIEQLAVTNIPTNDGSELKMCPADACIATVVGE